MLLIRDEEPCDTRPVFEIVRKAFGRTDEARLVDALRQAGAATLSLVAVENGAVAGHILFSPVRLEPPDGPPVAGAGLAPVCVLPERQRLGIGSTLVHTGLARLRETGHRWVAVLGHPDYYPRFGFRPASAFGLRCAFEAPANAFMVLPLVTGALDGCGGGLIRYRPEFDAV